MNLHSTSISWATRPQILRYLLAALALNLIVIGWFLLGPKVSESALIVFFPGFWLVSLIAGRFFAASQSIPLEFAVLVLVSSIVNITLYAAALFLLVKFWRYAREPQAAVQARQAAIITKRLFTGINLRSTVVEFSPKYKGPVRWLVITIWSLCLPSLVALAGVLLFYALGWIMELLSTNAGAAGRLLYYLSVYTWLLAIPSTVFAFVGALGLLYYKVPARTNWSAFGFAAASGVVLALTLLLFVAMR